MALKNLSQQLAPLELELSAAVQLGILLQALYEHSAKAGDAGWSIPAVGREEQLEAGVQFADDVDDQYGVLRLKSLQPYWMEKSTAKEPVSDSVVYNDVELDGFMLLTGPNMAGKPLRFCLWLCCWVKGLQAFSPGLKLLLFGGEVGGVLMVWHTWQHQHM